VDERRARGLRELAVLVVLWIGYTVVRATAGTDVRGAHESARTILHLERALHLDIELAVNQWALGLRGVEVAASFMYATCHLLVTGLVLLWLYHWHPAAYRPLRTALVAATAFALACYLALPTAPPRFVAGYVDVLQRTADVGWWPATSGAGPAPTNELAAFPSMHAGWSLWVGIALVVAGRRLVTKVIGVAYTVTVAAVVVLTANHWVLDVLAGWAAVVVPVVWCLHRVAWPPGDLAGTSVDVTRGAGALSRPRGTPAGGYRPMSGLHGIARRDPARAPGAPPWPPSSSSGTAGARRTSQGS
jgi:hypothetical protein